MLEDDRITTMVLAGAVLAGAWTLGGQQAFALALIAMSLAALIWRAVGLHHG